MKRFIEDGSMVSLLQHLKNLSRLPKEEWQCAVIGNESGDLDSIASTLCFSLLKGMVPILNFSRSELAARKEVLYLLDQWKISSNLLYFKEDIKAFHGQLTLIDHNHLAIDQEFLKPLVVSIVDHHPGTPEKFLQVVDKEIVLCGSTASIVASKAVDWPEDAASFLLGAILLDTHCLEDPIKTTQLDRQMVDQLAIGDTKSFYSELQALKLSVKEEDLLSRDAKTYREGKLLYAISSVPRKLEFDPLVWEKYRNERGVHALFVFVTNAEKGVKSLTLYTPDKRLLKALAHVMPIPLVKEEEMIAHFHCPESLSRKSLQPKFSFSEPSIQSLISVQFSQN